MPSKASATKLAAPAKAAPEVTTTVQAPAAQPPAVSAPVTQPSTQAPEPATTNMPATPAPAEQTDHAPKSEETKADAPKHVRRQLADAVGINIQPARVRNLLSDSVINSGVRTSLDEIKTCTNWATLSEQTVKFVVKSKPDPVDEKKAESVLAMKLHSAFTTGDKAALTELAVDDAAKEVLSGLVSHHLLRIGDDAVTALAATANLIVHELAVHGAKGLVAEKKKTLALHHVVNDELEKLNVWPFIRTLKCVADARLECKAAAAELARRAEANEKAPKRKKDKSAPATPQATPATQPSAESAAQPADEKKAKRDKVPEDGFKHHIKEILKSVVKEHVAASGQNGGDISDPVRTFISHVVHELVVRYSKLIRRQTLFAGVKTIKFAVIVSINDFLLTDAELQWPELDKFVDSRVQAYVEYSQKSKEPKESKESQPAKESSKQDDGSAAAAKPKRGASKKKPSAETPAAPPQVTVPATA